MFKMFIKWLKSLFNKKITPYSVEDKVTFKNVDKTLTLYVRGDAASFVSGLRKAQEELTQTLTDEASECEQVNCARMFARTLFGDEQGDQLVDFYNEPLAVISVCGMYFQKRLAKKITKAQKK